MSYETDLSIAYGIGYDDALAGRSPDSDKVRALAPRIGAEAMVAELREEANMLTREVLAWRAENAKLRELVHDMWHDGMCECDERHGGCAPCEYGFPARMRKLGIEVDV